MLFRSLDAEYDERYFGMVQHIGAVHAELDVKPRWNVGNYATYTRLVYARLAKNLKGDVLVNTMLAFQRAFMLDASLAVEAYQDGLLQRLAEVNERLAPSTEVLSTGAAHRSRAPPLSQAWRCWSAIRMGNCRCTPSNRASACVATAGAKAGPALVTTTLAG